MRVEIVTAALVGIAVPLACQAVGPLSTLGPEFTQLYTIVSAAVMFVLAAQLVRRLPPLSDASPQLRLSIGLTRSVWVAFALGGAAFVAMAVANQLGPRCNLAEGVLLFWVTWTPAVALACVLGVAVGARGWRWWAVVAALGGLAAADLLCVGAMQAVGARVLDPLIGAPLFVDVWSRNIELPAEHAVQRGLVLLAAVSLWYLVQWFAGRGAVAARTGIATGMARERGLQLAIVIALIVAMAVMSRALDQFAGPRAGAASKQLVSEHFVLRYGAGGNPERHAPIIAREAEWQRALLVGEWGIDPRDSITIQVYGDRKAMGRLTGLSSAHVSDGTMYIRWSDVFEPLFRHEMVHAMQPRRAGMAAHLRHHGLFEGIAEAHKRDYHLHPLVHRRVAARMRAGILPPAREALGAPTFLARPSLEAYAVAASFSGFLVLEYGVQAHFALLEDLDFERVYGLELEALDARWREFLQRVPVGAGDIASETRISRYRKRGYLCDPCRKLGAAVPTQDQAYWNHHWATHDDEAATIARQEYERSGELRWALLLVQALQGQQRYDEAAALAREMLSRDDLDPGETYATLELLRSCLQDAGEWEELAVVADEMFRLDPWMRSRLSDRPLWLWLDEESSLRAEIGEALAFEQREDRRDALAALQSTHPGSQAIQAQVLSESRPRVRLTNTGAMTEQEARSVIEWLEDAHAAPGLCDAFGPWVLMTADHAFRSGHVNLGEAICTSFGGQTAEPLNRLRAERCLQRAGWERAHPELP